MSSGWDQGLHDRAASEASPFVSAHVSVADDEEKHDGIYEVGEGEIESAEDLGSTGGCADSVESGLGVFDFDGEGGQRLLKRGRGGGVILVRSVSEGKRSAVKRRRCVPSMARATPWLWSGRW